MKKLKQNTFFKCLVAIVLTISLAAMLLSGILFISLLSEGAYNPGGKELLRNNIYDNFCSQYTQSALEYYEAYIKGENTEDWEDYFSEENTNYFFEIQPENNDSKLPLLKNYSCEDYQYTNWETHNFQAEPVYEDTYTFHLTGLDILMHLNYKFHDSWEQDDYLTDEMLYYSDEAYNLDDSEGAYYESDPDPYIYDFQEESDRGNIYIGENGDFLARYRGIYPDDTRVAMVQSNDWSWDSLDYTVYYDENFSLFLAQPKGSRYYMVLDEYGPFASFLDDIKKVLDASYEYEVSYSDAKEKVTVITLRDQSEPVRLKYYVKSDLTAQDDFYSSWYLEYLDMAIDYTVPVLIISSVLTILCGLFLIFAAGHRKNQEEICLNAFDRIPIDLLLLISLIGPLCIIDYLNYTPVSVTACVCVVILMLLASFELIVLTVTTASRLKVEGFRFLKNSIIFRVFNFLWKIVKKVCRRCFDLIAYLAKHISIYWKFLGGFLMVNAILFFFAAAENAGGTLALLVLETVVCGLLLTLCLVQMNKLKKAGEKLAGGESDYKVDMNYLFGDFKEHGENLNHISDGIQLAVTEQMKSERMKTELITNVSHDIKTPLTSIISYVDLLSKEELNNKDADEYVQVLERQSARLKKLIQDLLDASKASTGNMEMVLDKTNIQVILEQTVGEFADRLSARDLAIKTNYPKGDVFAMADGKLLWRVFDNLITNIAKYAQSSSRVYIDLRQVEEQVQIVFKNISAEALNISGDELMERFVRGDSSRNTEGSGLGLSIAKSLVEMMHGTMEVVIDGDLFKVMIELPAI